MTQNQFQSLFTAVASMSVPLERALRIAIVTIKNDKNISEKYKEELLGSVKSLLFHSLELHIYVGSKNPKLDFSNAGKTEYTQIREAYRYAFPSAQDENINLHEYITEESDNRAQKEQSHKKQDKKKEA